MKHLQEVLHSGRNSGRRMTGKRFARSLKMVCRPLEKTDQGSALRTLARVLVPLDAKHVDLLTASNPHDLKNISSILSSAGVRAMIRICRYNLRRYCYPHRKVTAENRV